MNSRPFLFVCLVFSLPAAGGSTKADEAYEVAKGEYLKLKKDEKRRELRHHWLAVGKRFDAVATQFPKSERAPEALFMSGQLFSDLCRLSGNRDDLESSQKALKKLIETFPKHRLADDAALVLARLLADRKNEPKEARRVVERALDDADDKKADLQKLLATLSKGGAAEDAGQKPDRIRNVESTATVKRRPSIVPGKAEPKTGTSQVTALADALKKLAAPVELAEGLTAPRARRTPPSRLEDLPSDDAPNDSEGEAAVEPAESGVLQSLQERLRDVRVGARIPDPEKKSRFEALAKQQQDDEVSLAEQLGLKVRRIVLDAGHGGHDTGAIGPTGVREKDVALAVVLKLKRKLETLGLTVVLTRDDDTFVPLDERTHFANREHGDLFISIHCNAAPSKHLRGIETYTLNTSSNRYAVRLAARENATTERGVNDLQYILADLATKANTGESQRLAERVQRSLVRGLSADYKGVRDLGTKEALFVVLLGAKMPSILVETSFLSNPEDELRLSSDSYQQALAEHIAQAVSGFLDARSKVAQTE